MYTLHFSPGTIALAVHVALEEVGAAHRLARLNFAEAEQRGDAYVAINPKGRVPTLDGPEGRLTETAAILLYLAQRHPEAGLAPLDDPFALAEINAFNLYLASTFHVAHAHKLRGHRWADDPAAIAEMKRKSVQTVTECALFVETRALRGPWTMGAAYSIADPYLYSVSRWLEGDGVDMTRIPKIVAHRKAMEARPAVRRALEAQGLEPMSA